MRRFILFILMFGVLPFVHAQSDTLNKYDAGKKNGVWVVYLNQYWKPGKDSSKASFYEYVYFDHNLRIWRAGWFNKKWTCVNTNASNPKSVRIKPLDGEYTWTENNGKEKWVYTYKNGYPQSMTGYKNGQIQSVWDYTKQWKGEAGSYFATLRDKKGVSNNYYYRRTKDKRKVGNWWGFFIVDPTKDGI